MKKYVWLLNPHGLEVEVDASQKEALLAKGFKELGNQGPRVLKKKEKINASIPGQNNYPFGGYGRVAELLGQCFEFDPESKNRIYIGYPRPIPREDAEKMILITAWEADRIPNDWINLSNNFDLLIVPSEWCKKVLKENGITTPIEVMIQGTDNFNLIEEVPGPNFNFLHYNAFSDYKRKGWDLVVKAFMETFGADNDVHLYLKGRKHDNEEDIKLVPERENIHIIIDNFKRYGIEELQEKTHCFVFPSRGEGVGLPPIETMARGIPTIYTDATGMTDYSEYGIPLTQFAQVPAKYDLEFAPNDPPHWVEPNLNQLKDLMWNVYRDYDKHKRAALRMAKKVKQKYSLESQRTRFKEILDKYI